MISNNESICPKCGGELKYYDNVKRVIRKKHGIKSRIEMKRFRCIDCRAVHRELMDYVFPYKQYEAPIIIGVIEEWITTDTLGFENYPSETTMLRWRFISLRLFSIIAEYGLK